MPYWDVVTRSFRIAWRHRYLWLIALFSGESGGNLSFNSWQLPANRTPDPGALQAQAASWVHENAGLIAGLVGAFVVLAIALFVLGAVCEGATVRASAEHDAERPFDIGRAWTAGVNTLWVVVRFRLLIFVLNLPVLVFAVAWLVTLLVAVLRQDVGLLLGAVFGGLLLFALFFAYALYLLFLDRFGSRAVILEEREALPALARAHRLLFKRLGRSLLVLVLSLAVTFAASIVLGAVSSVLFLPLLVVIYSGSAAATAVAVVTAIVVAPVFFVVGGFLAAQSSSYWTLAFRRLDVDYGQSR